MIATLKKAKREDFNDKREQDELIRQNNNQR